MRAKFSRIAINSLIFSALMSPMAAVAQDELNHHPSLDAPADGRGNHSRHLPPRAKSGTGGTVVQGNGISYHNGPVMRSGVNIYYIWYGNWALDSTANAILTAFATNVGGSNYFNINTTYGDTLGNVPNTPSTIKYVSSVSDAGSLGTSLSDTNIWTLVNNALNAGTLPVDPNGIYFVLTAPFVAETSGFLTQYCGWHTYQNYSANNIPIKYSFVGNPAASMGACSAQSTGPNGDAKADAMVSVLVHELEEAASDPLLNAWSDSSGAENADKCAWTFGTTYTVNGAYANMKIGSRDYLIQRNWVNAGGGYCALSYANAPGFGLSVSPTSQSVAPGGTTGNYTVTATALNGWSKTATYKVTAGLPAGASAIISGNLIAVSTTAGTTSPGSYSFTISGTDGTLTHTTAATLVVTASTFSISIGIAPSSLTVKRPLTGSVSARYTVTVTATAGYVGVVNLSLGGAATGVSLSLSPASISGGSGTSILTATVTSSALKTSRTLAVTGSAGTVRKSAAASLLIN